MIRIIESIDNGLLKKFSEPYLDGYNENAVEYWYGLTGGEYPELETIFNNSNINYKDLYNQLFNIYGKPSKSEWLEKSNSVEEFNIHFNYSNIPVEFKTVNVAKGKGYGAECVGNENGITIFCRPEKLSKEIICHELGHALESCCYEINLAIANTNIFGMYNNRLNSYVGNYGNASAIESWADCVSSYICHKSSLKQKYPLAFEALEIFFKASPTAMDFILDNYKKYEELYRNSKEWEVWVD